MKSLSAAFILLATIAAHAAEPTIAKPAPNFTLLDIYGKSVSLSDFKGKYIVLEWTNPGCPFVKKHYESGNMQTLQKEQTAKGVVWLSIASSAKGKEGHMTAAEWQKEVQTKKPFQTTVLMDEDGQVGRLYGAKTTPHMFVIGPTGNLIYKGAIDDKPTYDKDDVKGAKNFVRAALEESMAGKSVSVSETKSYGCSVKYK